MLPMPHVQYRFHLPERITIHCSHTLCREWHCQYTTCDIRHVKIITSNKHSPSMLGYPVTNINTLGDTINQWELSMRQICVQSLSWPLLRKLQPHLADTMGSFEMPRTCLKWQKISYELQPKCTYFDLLRRTRLCNAENGIMVSHSVADKALKVQLLFIDVTITPLN